LKSAALKLAPQPPKERTHRKARRRGWRARLALGLIVMLVALVVLGILAVFPAASAASHLQEARAEMSRGRAALLREDAQEAAAAFREAHSDLLQARDSVNHPLIQLAGLLPILGRSPDATEMVVEAAIRSSLAGLEIADALRTLPEGLSALVPRDGRIPLQPLRRLAPPLARAHGLLEEASALVARAPDSLLLPPVRDALTEFRPLLEEARRGALAASSLALAMPAFLGDGESRRYFVGAQNPAEQRGTGGLIGSFAILTVKNGELSLGDFHSIQELDTVPVDRVAPPNPDYAARYDPFSSRGYWSNINMTPDFPSAAVAIERLYREVEGVEVDGVILADPHMFAALLEAMGSVEIPATGYVLKAGNAVDYLTNEAYSALHPRDRKAILGDAAEQVLGRFIGGAVGGRVSGDPSGRGDRSRDDEGTDRTEERAPGQNPSPKGRGGGAAVVGRALVKGASSGHLLLHSTDPAVQSAFGAAGVSGALGDPSGDFLALSLNNASATKIDYYLEQAIRYDVDLGPEGTGVADAQVRLTNGAPLGGQPSYVIGPHPRTTLVRGQSSLYVSIYSASTGLLESFRRDGHIETVGSQTELGYPVYPTTAEILAGQSQTLQYEWAIDDAWEEDGGQGSYRLVYQGQTSIQPADLSVSIRVPEGMHVTSVTPGMQIEGDRVSWEGTVEDGMAFEVDFQRPALARAWQHILDFLNQPAIRLE
jgi:hypothetical protein